MTEPTGSSASPASSIYNIPKVTSVVNVGLMTTAARLPPDCQSSLWNFNVLPLWPSNPSSWTAYTLGCAISTCCPSSQEPYSTPYQWLTSYHSPGVCPKDYITCAGPGNLTPGPKETLAFCCPKYFSCPGPARATSGWFACQSDLDSTTIANLMDNTRDQRTLGQETTVFRPVVDGVTYQVKVVAYPIQIRWKEEDRSPAAVSGTSSSTSTIGPSPHGLSTGAKIGLGVGLGLGVILVVVFSWWCSKVQRRHKGKSKQVPSSQYKHPMFELDTSKPRNELNGDMPPSELYTPGNNLNVEPLELESHGRSR